MKSIVKITALVITACTLLLSGQVFAAKTPKLLFNVTAKTGNIRQLSKNNYLLTLRMPDTKQVTVFSSRMTKRTSTQITGKQLKQIWQSRSASSFKNDPPNVVLTTNSIPQAIAIATAISTTNNSLRFTLRTHKSLPTGQQTGIYLTIDDDIFCAHPDCHKTCNVTNIGCNICYTFQDCKSLKKNYPKCIGVIRNSGPDSAKCTW